jgi:Kef-type K+ transport system membrane component KefB
MEILYILLVILVVTRLGAEIAERLGQAALVGELIAGVMLGVVAGQFSGAFPVLSDLGDDRVFQALTDLGIFFLMLLAGTELQPHELTESSKGALAVAVGGTIVPMAMGMGLGWYFLPQSDLKVAQVLFLGVALAVTAIPVAVKVLMDLGRLETKVGRMVVSAAIIDDVLSLLLLAVLTSVLRTGSIPDMARIGWLITQIVTFFAITIAVGRLGFPKASQWFKRARVEEFEFSALLIAALAYAMLAEALGLHFIMGAFVAGLFFSRGTPDPETFEDVKKKISGITTGFLAPVFFASIGLHLSFKAFVDIPVFLALIVVVAIAGKVIGAGVTALSFGMGARDATAVGIGMSGRGAVELVVADVALRAGLFSMPEPPPPVVASLFSAVVVMAIATTLLMPLGLKWIVSLDTSRS